MQKSSIKLLTTSCLFLVVSFFNQLTAQRIENLELLKQIDFGEGGSGIWGHTDSSGIEYAVIGTRQSIRILSLEDPSNPIERLVIPGANNIWREARSWGNYIYVTTEGPDGITIIDATNAPNEFQWKRWKPAMPNAVSDTIRTVHSINMDTMGYMYLNGTSVSNRGVIICDLNNTPYTPEIIANVGDVYTHDCYANAQYLFTADLSSGVGIYDIADRSNPKLINRFQTPSSFAHNIWTSPDGSILYTTDEVSGAYLATYDISDIMNVKFLDKYRNEDSQIGKVIPHNTYAVGDFAVTSWYTDGVLIHDMTRPDNIIKVGEYDTYLNDASLPANGSWFYGCWGVYANFASGTIIASDINSGFWVFKPDYQRACYLEGKAYATDTDGIIYPIAGAKITLVTDRIAGDVTDGTGNYKTGIANEGSYTVVFEHPDYGKVEAVVTLVSGEVVIQDFVLQANFITGKVLDTSGLPINDAVVHIVNKKEGTYQDGKSNGEGKFKVPASLQSDYQIFAAAWGYKGKLFEVNSFDNIVIELEEGYEDDFFADLGWTVTEKGTAGNWERVIPVGTFFQNQICNPDMDAQGDLGNFAYITGNGGSNPGDNDLDNGRTVLESPFIKAADNDSMVVSFQYWFFNSGGNGTPNDYLQVSLYNGENSLELLKTQQSASEWKTYEARIAASDFEFTEEMQIIAKSEDVPSGHLVEAGLDQVKVRLIAKPVSTQNEEASAINVYPNPTNGNLVVKVGKGTNIEIRNEAGINVYRKTADTETMHLNISSLPAGIYFITTNNANSVNTAKVIKN